MSRAYARLATDTLGATRCHELVQSVRDRAARLLEAPVLNGYHPGVEALVNLSRFESAHLRPASEWPGTTSSWRAADHRGRSEEARCHSGARLGESSCVRKAT
jgi:hypothetical protein